MVRPEEQYKSLQIFRPVIETDALRRFMTTADALAATAFRNENDPAVLLAEIEPDTSPDDFDADSPKTVRTRNVEVARHKMYDSEKLKLPLLDRRTLQSEFRPLLRALERLMAEDGLDRSKSKKAKSGRPPLNWQLDLRGVGLQHDHALGAPLEVNFGLVASESNSGYGHRGRELSLVASMSPETLQLNDEAEICFQALLKLNRRLALPVSKSMAAVSFMRLPSDASDEQVVEYAQVLQSHLPITLSLDDPRPVLT